MKGYSKRRYPVMPDAVTSIDSLARALYCSNDPGGVSFGACTKARLPRPAMRTA